MHPVFGFTQQEVTDALDEYGLEESSASVRQWYNGFTFGSHRDIYNPWSITKFLKRKKDCFLIGHQQARNGLASKLIRTASADLKVKNGNFAKWTVDNSKLLMSRSFIVSWMKTRVPSGAC